MGLSDIVWVDGRSGSQAKTKTKQTVQLKLAGHDLWHIVGHFDIKSEMFWKNPKTFQVSQMPAI